MLLKHKDDRLLIDRILSPLAVVAPLFTVPQVYEVWFLQNVDGVSSLSWFLMGIMALLWFWHAVRHKDKILMINTLLMVFFNFSIAFGTMLYSNKELFFTL
jgi:hypothetical protein